MWKSEFHSWAWHTSQRSLMTVFSLNPWSSLPPGVWLSLWPPAAPSFFFSHLLSLPPLSPSLPQECAHHALPSISLVISRSGAVWRGLRGTRLISLLWLSAGTNPPASTRGPSSPPLPTPLLHLLSSWIRFSFSQDNYFTPPFPLHLVTSSLHGLLHGIDQHMTSWFVSTVCRPPSGCRKSRVSQTFI